jgi:hypothetical protein
MEPIGCAASVAALIGLCYNAISYISKAKGGHLERQKLHKEVDRTLRMLKSMQDRFADDTIPTDTSWFRLIEKLFQPGEDMEHLEQALNALVDKLGIKQQKRLIQAFKTVTWPLDAAEVTAMTEQIEKIKNNISFTLQRANTELGLDTNTKVTQLQSTAARLELQHVVNWISPLDFRTMQQSEQKCALKNTGQWFFDKMEFLGWVNRRAPSLWCYGIPGAGKTMLASAAFDKIANILPDDDPLRVIVFFDANDESTHTVEAVLSSLLRQMVEHRQVVSPKLRELYDGCSTSGKAGRLSLGSLKTALQTELEHIKYAYVILDGLDEVPSEQARLGILNEVKALNSQLQLMVFSRPLMDVQAWFSGQERSNRCQTTQKACRSGDSSDETDDPSDLDSDTDSTDGHSSHTEIYNAWVQPRCEVCQISKSSTKSSPRTACYQCQCQCLICGDCYDRLDKCAGCDSEGDLIRYLWPQRIEIWATSPDIELYVQWRIDQNPTLRRLFEKGGSVNSLEKRIIRAVVENCKKM